MHRLRLPLVLLFLLPLASASSCREIPGPKEKVVKAPAGVEEEPLPVASPSSSPDPAGAPVTAAASPSPTPTPEEAPRAQAHGDVYLIRDTGKRCITSPCPSWAAVNVQTRQEREITGVDLAGVAKEGKAAAELRATLLNGRRWARGEIRTVPKAGPAGDGTVLFVTEVLNAEDPL